MWDVSYIIALTIPIYHHHHHPTITPPTLYHPSTLPTVNSHHTSQHAV